MIDAQLASYATVRQLEYLEAVDKYGSGAKAASALGVSKAVINRSLQALRKKAAKQAHSRKAVSPQYVPEAVTTAGKKIMVLPDVQAKPGADFSYLTRIGQYMVDKKPDHVVCLGDFADMPSLSSYDKGKKSFEGRRYRRDIEAAHEAMRAFLRPMHDYNEAAAKAGTPQYHPKRDMLYGNHEDRINRVINEDPKLDGVLSLDDLEYEDFGWTTTPFLEVKVIEGIAFSHYFTSGLMGRAASTAAAQLRKTNMSCVAGHQQGKQIAYATRADGSTITSIITGSCYEHTEEYLGSQGNKHWRGLVFLHDVEDGAFDEMWISVKYINQRYPRITMPPDCALPKEEQS